MLVRANSSALNDRTAKYVQMLQQNKSNNVISKGSQLEKLKLHSHLVHDTKGDAETLGEITETAATVSSAVLMTALKMNVSGDVGALEGAMVYEPCNTDYCDTEDERLQCVIDKAFVNLGAMMADKVDGKVSVEVDVTVAHDVAAIEAKARRMKAMFDELKVPDDKVLYKIPATWEGIAAVENLESSGIHCHVTQVYCIEQAAAAARAGASLIQVYVNRVRTWYSKQPREMLVKNNLSRADDPGVELTRQISALIHNEGHKAKVIAASIRNAEDAVALAGCDYILLNDRVIQDLNGSFNNVENNFAGSETFEVPEVTMEAFDLALRESPGAEELDFGLSRGRDAEDKLKDYIRQKVLPANY